MKSEIIPFSLHGGWRGLGFRLDLDFPCPLTPRHQLPRLWIWSSARLVTWKYYKFKVNFLFTCCSIAILTYWTSKWNIARASMWSGILAQLTTWRKNQIEYGCLLSNTSYPTHACGIIIIVNNYITMTVIWIYVILCSW